MAQAPWDREPSPRRGFTLIREANAFELGPVVVCSDGSPEGLRAVEAATREALPRSANLIVLDHGEPDLRQLITHPDNGSTAVLISAIAGALQSPQVEVLRVEEPGPDLDEVSRYCREVGASLLVLTRKQADRLSAATSCDILTIAQRPSMTAS